MMFPSKVYHLYYNNYLDPDSPTCD
ncbi:rCG63376 [Rattus norvegicus]|uniref:RCG63376 n=1 Tax=Rattus norvegicus TaxID=10116 RepID=A6KB30_RAT|nr:rCG63376 [Rattus norvegicus]